MLRVISGTAKGHKLKTVKGDKTRPTSDMIKESMFNIIADYIYQAYILDAFAGTGSLGIEALSRGAQKAVFIDRNRVCIEVIKENLIHTKLLGKAEIIQANSEEYIRKMSQISKKFDIIFMDPPYNKNIIIPMLNNISYNDIINTNGIIMVEHDCKDEIPAQVGRLNKFKEKRYGITLLSVYRCEG